MHQFDNLAEEAAHWARARRTATFTNRQFVRAVREELAAAGRPDIPFERGWIDEDTPGFRLLVHVPVGSELTIPLRVRESFFDMTTGEDLKRQATEVAQALVNLKLAEAMLTRYVRNVRRSANTIVAAARAQGLDILLVRVGLTPTYASHLSGKAWKDAAHHALAAVTVRHTSFYLRPDTSTVWIEEAAQVADEFRDILDEQRERQDRLGELDRRGADLIVDAITVDLLESHGLDVTDLLTRVWKEQCVNLTVDHRGMALSLSLACGDGRVSASMQLPEGRWNGRYLWFTNGERDADHHHLIGRSLGDLLPHPVFTARPIVSVESQSPDQISFDLSDKLLFDADTGLLWREERLAG